jgi:hypothetical protein
LPLSFSRDLTFLVQTIHCLAQGMAVDWKTFILCDSLNQVVVEFLQGGVEREQVESGTLFEKMRGP